jgi:hypothetical protein
MMLAVVAALGGWAWKSMLRVSKERVEEDDSVFSSSERVLDLRAHAEVAKESTPSETQPAGSVPEVSRKRRRKRLETGSDWSSPVGPDGEATLKQARAAIDERFRSLKDDRSQEGRTAA